MDGIVTEIAGGYELRFERHLKHPIAKVFAALTQPEELVAWLAEATVELTQGGRIELRWLNTNDKGEHSVARGRVTAYDPPRLVEYDTDIHGRLRWELTPEADGCVLNFTCTLSEPTKTKLVNHLAGWHIHLEHLADALAGARVDWPRWNEEHRGRWAEHRDRYAATVSSTR